MSRTEPLILADMMERTRQLTRFYLSQLKAADPYIAVRLGDMTFNSIYWLTAHLIWAEHNLIMRLTGSSERLPIWLKHYSIGSDGTLHEDHGSYRELLDLMKTVHAQCMDYLRAMPAATLDEINTAKMEFGDGDMSNRTAIMHAIRHEGTHIGHLGYLYKISQKKSL